MGTDQLRGAMERAGLRVTEVTLGYRGDDQLISASGFKPDGSPFAVNDAAFSGDPVQFVSTLATSLARASDVIAAAVPVAKAIVDGKKAMSLADKMATLAARSQAVPKALEARADALLPRLATLEKSGAVAFGALDAIVADAEKGVASAEAAVRALTNGGPPLSDSGGSQAASTTTAQG